MLACEGLGFAYRRGRDVLRDLTCAFAGGRITVVVGPNGSGKTTLTRLLIGALTPGSGRVSLGGVCLGAMGARARASRIAYVAQRPSAGGDFDVRAVVAMGRLAVGGDRAAHRGAVDRAIERFDLGRLAGEAFGTLSVGQQQRVAMARAFAQLDGAGDRDGAGVLVGDEVFSALDPAHASVAAGELRELCERGASVVLVIHDLTTAARLGDDALALGADGRCAASGEAADVLTPARMGSVFGVGFGRAGEGVLLPALGGARGGA